MAVILSPIGGAAAQFFTNNGIPLAGGLVYTYAAGTNTPQATYTSNTGLIQHSNPIVLDSSGRVPGGEIWLTENVSYKFVLKDATDVLIGTYDNIDPSFDASQISYTAPYTGSVTTTVQDKLAQYVSVKDFGAVGDGVADDTTAIQAAISSDQPIYFPEGVYLVTSTIEHSGPVNIYGNEATIKSSCLTFKFTDASNSVVTGLKLLPTTVPYTILRNTSTWVNTSGDVVQSYQGYMPTTPADDDIWSGLSASIKAQTTTDTFDWPCIWFFSSSSSGNTNVDVSNITGYTLTIAFDGYSSVNVHDCNFGAGAAIGGIVFNNAVAQDYQYGSLGYTLPRGTNNKAVNNVVRYATYSNIWISGNDYFVIDGNQSSYCGETGIKCNQTDGSATNPVAVVSTHGVISNNISFNNFNDGIDYGAVYNITTAYPVYTICNNNQVYNNKYSGIIAVYANYGTFVGNHVSYNGQFGIQVVGNSCTIVGNTCEFNSYHPELYPGVQLFDIFISGNNNNSAHNYIYNPSAPSTWNYVHNGLGGGSPTFGSEGSDFSNICSGGDTRVAVSANIPSAKRVLVSPDGGSNANSGTAFAVFNSDSNQGGVEMDANSGSGICRLRGNASAGATIQFTPTYYAANLGAKAAITYEFANDLMKFGTSNGGYTSPQAVLDAPNNAYYPATDGVTKLGFSSQRWSTVYAVTGSINTSDENQKQDIADLTAAEIATAKKIKTIFKTFKFKSSVEEKGEEARIHVGVMAQDVQAAFTENGLNADRYGLFCSDTWYEVNGQKRDETGKEYTQDSPGAVAVTQLGIRYDELLSFVVAAI